MSPKDNRRTDLLTGQKSCGRAYRVEGSDEFVVPVDCLNICDLNISFACTWTSVSAGRIRMWSPLHFLTSGVTRVSCKWPSLMLKALVQPATSRMSFCRFNSIFSLLV